MILKKVFFNYFYRNQRRRLENFPKRLVLSTSVVIALIANSSITLAGEFKAINLQEAIAKTLDYNPRLRALDYRLKAQEGRIQQAGISPSMQLDVGLENTLGTGDYSGINSSQVTVSIAWILERGIRQQYIDVASANKNHLSSSTNIIQLDAAAKTAHLYLDSLAFQSRMVNTEKSVMLAEETIQAVVKRVEAGRTPEAELSRAKAELARRKLEREDIEHELVSANRLLAAQWGVLNATFQKVEGDILSLPKLLSFETLKSRIQQNPEFAQILSNRQLRQAELDLELAKNKPSWQVSAGLRHLNDTGDQALVAGVSIPFGKGTSNAGRISEARAKLEQSSLQESVLRVRIETELFVLYEKLKHNSHVIESVRDEIIPPLEKALQETRRAYNLGRYSYLELRSVQAELLDANNALIEASINAHKNLIEIERLSGVQIAQLSNP